jgi:hypothetical protein
MQSESDLLARYQLPGVDYVNNVSSTITGIFQMHIIHIDQVSIINKINVTCDVTGVRIYKVM